MLSVTLAIAQSRTDRLNVDYARVSLDDVGAAEGVASQHSENEEFAEDIGRPLDASYQDNDISAFTGEERPQFLRLMADAARDLIGAVVVWHADRLTRDVEEALWIIKVFRAHGVRLFSEQKGGEYLLDRASGRAEFIADVNVAARESGHKGERVSLARKRQARTGRWGGGIRAYGWGVPTGRVRTKCLNPKASLDQRIYVDVPVLDMGQHNPEEAREIRRWGDELLATRGNVTQLLADIRKRRVPTVSEKDGRRAKYRGKEAEHSGWTRATIVKIVTSPRTSGHQVYKGEVIKWNAYPAILPEETRQALIVILDDPARLTTPGCTPKWLITLIAGCGLCGASRCITRRGGRRDRPNQGPSYRCKECGRGIQPADLVDEYVTAVACHRLSRPDLAKLIAPERLDIDVPALRQEMSGLQVKKTEASLSYARGALDLEMLETVKAEADRQISEIRGWLAEASSGSPLADFLETDTVEAATAVWKTLSIGRRREIVRSLMDITLLKGESNRLDPDAVVITPRRAGVKVSRA